MTPTPPDTKTPTPKYDALLKQIESLPRIEGDRLLHAFAKQMEQTYMDSRFDDITKAGSEAIWNAVQKVGPWSESNDMPWEDEILCGLSIADERLTAATQRIAELEAHAERLAGALEKANCALREDKISSNIIRAENQARRYAITRDCQFIYQRCVAALSISEGALAAYRAAKETK